MTRAEQELQRGGKSALDARPFPPGSGDEFRHFAALVRSQVEERLPAWLDARVSEARARGEHVFQVADAVRALILRGGKRMRPVLLAAAYEACTEDGAAAVVSAGVSLEMLQGYLLIHDDWMDGDDTRRGGPSVPALMAARFEPKVAASMSVLAGDLAASWARRAIFEVALPAEWIVAAAVELALVEAEVVQGQILDVAGAPRTATEIETMHALKTSSYSTRGPVRVGARLAGASDAQLEALTDFAQPLGVAFQLRDDLLGTFGDARVTGKPAGTDLRRGRRSAVLAAAETHDAVLRVFGRIDAPDEDVRQAVAWLEASGARARVEDRIRQLSLCAMNALEHAPLRPRGRALLSQAVQALTERSH